MLRKRYGTPIWRQLVCWLMAFYVINVSIDAPDGYVTPDSRGEYREDLSINEIESFSELVLEELLGLHNAVPEHDEPEDDEGLNQFSKIFFDWIIPSPSPGYPFPRAEGYLPVVYQPYTHPCYFSKSARVNTPPPRTVS